MSAPHRHTESSALFVASSTYGAHPDPDTTPPIRWQTGNGRGPGRLRAFVNVYVNDEDMRYLQKEATALKEGDTISIVPSIAGGC